ncbi:hypothetical protein EPN95_02725 [Patescibacteria group bacterium]|nr:MAG: hypothetical protein EPN95_02725 [Patescibacteria group bacterium]
MRENKSDEAQDAITTDSDEPQTLHTSHTVPRVEEPQPIDLPVKKKSHKKKLIVILVITVLVLAALAVGVWWWFTQKQTTNIAKKTTQTTKAATDKVAAPDTLARYIKPTTGETWTGVSKPIADPGYIVNTDSGTTTNYYEVGKHGDNVIVMATTAEIGLDIELFERQPDGKAIFIAQPNANTDYSSTDTKGTIDGWTADHWSSNVTINKDIHYDSLSLPTSLSIGNGESVSAPTYPTLGDQINDSSTDKSVTITTLQTLGSSKLIKIERKYVDTGLTAINYAVDTAIGTRINMIYTPTNLTVDKYSWDNSTPTSGMIGGIVRGCGAIGSSVSRTDLLTDADFVPAGKSDTGKTIYAFKDSTASLLKVLYDEYTSFNSYDGAPAVVPFADFLASHAVLAYKSANNGWLIYSLDTYAAVGGCGKPVIYLYPAKTETVSVKVGASVTASEPLYSPTQGWKNVVATPSGQLTYNGLSYSSLFWEGTGFGQYPGIVSGTVVPYAKAASTMRTQLFAQGLNIKETNDFMDYWQSRIPHKPYVRLSWLNTAQMNELAPLTISPQPTSLIRVFLDMRGLDQSVPIPAQTFVAPNRVGFTVVEWGGLLHTKN